MSKPIVLTQEGLKRLENELETLKTTKRKEVAQRIKVALSFGDLSENSEYDEAKNEQALTEAKILEIEALLKNVKIIDESKLNTESIHIGCKIKIKKLETNDVFVYKIVGSSESDPAKELISDESPLGKYLIGHKKDEIVDVKTPVGIKQYEILSISK